MSATTFPFWNIHTHHQALTGERALVNVDLRTDPEQYASAEFITAGIHPWKAATAASDWERLTFWEHDPRCVALGESGLDKRCEQPFEVQLLAFHRMAAHACTHHRPLLIHNVKASNELIRLHREYAPESPWIIHGFRGKPNLAEQLLAEGFYLSFGFRYQEAALRIVPLDRLFLESDEEQTPIGALYEEVARLRGISIEAMAEAVASNVNQLFFRL